MNYVLLTLTYITEKENYHEYLQEDEDARNMTIWLLENMIISTRSRMFCDFFAKVRAKIIWDILLMLLTTSEKEEMDAVEDPKEFISLAIDVWDKQESKTVKTQAAKWLEAFADKIDGSISFLSMFCIQAIDWYINEKQNNIQSRMNYLVLIEFFKHKFLSHNRPEIIIETWLMSLTIVSYLLPKRVDIIAALDVILKRNLEPLITSHILIQSRLALFLGYFADILFRGDDEKFKTWLLNFLLGSIGYPEQSIVVGYQSCETLVTLIGDKQLIPKIEKYVLEIWTISIEYIMTSSLTLFFDFLNEFTFIYK